MAHTYTHTRARKFQHWGGQTTISIQLPLVYETLTSTWPQLPPAPSAPPTCILNGRNELGKQRERQRHLYVLCARLVLRTGRVKRSSDVGDGRAGQWGRDAARVQGRAAHACVFVRVRACSSA